MLNAELSQDYIPIEDVAGSIKVYDFESAKQLTYPNVPVGPNSFCDPRDPLDAECPPPKYFDTQLVTKPLPTEKK